MKSSICKPGIFLRIRDLMRANSGVAMIEMAFIFPIFFFMTTGIIEFALITFGNAMMDSSLNQFARASMVGCMNHDYDKVTGFCKTNSLANIDYLKGLIKDRSVGLVNTSSANFCLNSDINGNPQQQVQTFICPDGNGGKKEVKITLTTSNLGLGADMTLMRIEYKWPIFTPLMKALYWHKGEIDYASAIIVRNEPFPTLENPANPPTRSSMDGTCGNSIPAGCVPKG